MLQSLLALQCYENLRSQSCYHDTFSIIQAMTIGLCHLHLPWESFAVPGTNRLVMLLFLAQHAGSGVSISGQEKAK